MLHFALAQAYRDGFQTSSLQSTGMAQGMYRRLGYVPVGAWQEWVPAHG